MMNTHITMDTNAIKLQHPELLLKPDENNFNMFCYALQVVFDVPEEIGNVTSKTYDGDSLLSLTGLMYDVVNHDLLWRPDVDGAVTYFHWLTMKTSERDPIISMFSYLFQNSEPYYNDPYEFTATEKDNRTKFYAYLRGKYQNADEYIKRIADMLGLSSVDCLPFDVSAKTINKKVWHL